MLFRSLLVFTDGTFEDHIRDVNAVLQRFEEKDLYCKPEKCYFAKKEIAYLGMKISPEGIAMDEDKVKAITDWPACQSVKQIRQFLGFANFYRQYIDKFADIVKPLTVLLKKDKPFKWEQAQDEALTALKKEFQLGRILRHPDPELGFIVEADASDYAIGAVLSQIENGEK